MADPPAREVIVVGAGVAAAAAARELRGRDVLILDAGLDAPADPPPLAPRLLHELRRRVPLHRQLVGDALEALAQLRGEVLSPKLKAPRMRFISARPDAAPATLGDGFSPTVSYARGGLANAWGAGVFRYDARDLAGWPIGVSDLDPCYDALTAHIGVSGTADDLAPVFGPAGGLQPPLPLGALATRFHNHYRARRSAFRAAGIAVGRLRSAILTREHDGRAAHATLNQEFFEPHTPSIYHPDHTLAPLRERGDIEYQAGWIVRRFRSVGDSVEVTARRIESGAEHTFRARHVLLAAGALNSARIALASADDRTSRLPILDNAITYLPLVDIGRIGCALDTASFNGAELALVYDPTGGDGNGDRASDRDGDRSASGGTRVQASLYGLAAPLKGDLFAEFPLDPAGNLAALRYVLPALLMLQVFHADEPAPGNHVQLGEHDALLVTHRARARGDAVERHLARHLVRAGYAASARLARHPVAGSSMHYAGPLAMRATPRAPFDTDRAGRLAFAPRVRVVDGAALPTLPSKHHTFTLMANAARVAQRLRNELD